VLQLTAKHEWLPTAAGAVQPCMVFVFFKVISYFQIHISPEVNETLQVLYDSP
jgi:hypothetical protein